MAKLLAKHCPREFFFSHPQSTENLKKPKATGSKASSSFFEKKEPKKLSPLGPVARQRARPRQPTRYCAHRFLLSASLWNSFLASPKTHIRHAFFIPINRLRPQT
jgi:hypothetical protein